MFIVNFTPLCYTIKGERRGIMNKHDDDLKNALDDIFGSDFIEIDTSTPEDTKSDEHDKDVIFKDSDEVSTIADANQSFVEPKINDDFENDRLKQTMPDDSLSEKTKTDENVVKENSALTNNTKIDNDKSNSFFSSKKIIIIFVIGFVLGIALIYILVNYVFGVTKVVNCSSSATDVGYKYTDEYKITYKKNKITYVESTYTYTALNDEYKEQIQHVKDDKLRAVINSNGMPGFTYLYENSDDYFKVNGYLDFELFDYEQIDGLNQESTPISYFKIDSNLTFEKLKSNLKENGYQCTSSK